MKTTLPQFLDMQSKTKNKQTKKKQSNNNKNCFHKQRSKEKLIELKLNSEPSQ